MRYLRIESGPKSEEPPRVIAALGAILPRANPDLDHLVEGVCVWWLEIEDTGEPCREIGFSASGEPLVIGPVGRNFGYLVDATDDWSGSTADSPEAAANFERTWSTVWPRFAALDPNDPLCT